MNRVWVGLIAMVSVVGGACGDGDAAVGDAGAVGDGGAVVACESDDECDDGNPCTTDLCDPDMGCQSLDACDDGDPCTLDGCDAATGCVTTELMCVDVRADTNRDGVVSLEDAEDDEGEDVWGGDRGAVLLANLDDDQATCPTDVTALELIACNDAADDVVNGDADLDDLARLRIAAWAGAPDDAQGRVSISSAAAGRVRLFIRRGDGFEHWPEPRDLGAAELREGVELAIEAKHIVRDAREWDGFVDVTLEVDGGTGAHGVLPSGEDTVRMRVAPLRFSHALQSVTELLVSDYDAAFVSELESALSAAGITVPVRTLAGLVPYWIGDYFHPGYAAMPGSAAPQSMRVDARATQGRPFTESEVVYTALRGPDVAAIEGYSPTTAGLGDSPTNLLILPPHSHDGRSWPHGRALRATTSDRPLDPAFEALLQAHGVGPALEVDASWLAVPQVTALFAVVPADSPRGWALLMADPELAIEQLGELQAAGFGAAELFVGKETATGASATVSIDELLSDVDILGASGNAARELALLREQLSVATGLAESEIISVPAIFDRVLGKSTHHLPSLVSGIVLDDGTYLAPDPFGPIISGSPYFEDQLDATLDALGVDVVYVDNWDVHHSLLGGLTHGVNAHREIPATPTWR